MRLERWVLAAALLLLGPAEAWSREPAELATELARIRGEVESLSDSLEDVKKDLRSTLRSLAAQKATVEMEIRREDVRLKQLEASRDKLRERLGELDRIEKQNRQGLLRPSAIFPDMGPPAYGSNRILGQ